MKMGVDYRVIGRRIKQKRKSLHFTQDRVAEALSVSVGYISQIERGVTKVNLDTLAKLAVFLQCDIAELVTGIVTAQENYLDQEIDKISRSMDVAQKQMLLEVANIILRQKFAK